MPVSDIGIDLGTKNSRILTTAKGIILSEPTVVVYDKDTDKIRAIGEEARQMEGHLTTGLELIWPIRQGVITDYVVLEKLLKYFISKALGRRAFRKPRITICVPSGITDVESKAIEEATYQSGARHVYMAKEPVAAAIGAGIDIMKPFGNMVVDIGAGSSEAAVMSVGGIVVQNSIKIAGGTFNQSIVSYVREKHGLFIDENIAEKIKVRIGTAIEEADPRTMEVKGRNISTGLPKVVNLSSEEIREALSGDTNQIIEMIHGVLEKTPPELAADIVNRGIILTGGGSRLNGMASLIEERTGVSTITVQDSENAAVIGTGKYADIMADA